MPSSSDADNRFAFVPELGGDKVMIYELDAEKRKAHAEQEPALHQDGAGRRPASARDASERQVRIPDQRAELDDDSYGYDASKGTLTEIQTLPTLPKDFSGYSSCAEVQMHPSGKFLYGSNRGHNSIVIYGVDPTSGKLTLIGHEIDTRKNPAKLRGASKR